MLAGWGTTGTFAVISILVGNICLQLAPESKFRVFNNVTNESYVDTGAMEAERLHVSATLACLTAVIQVKGSASISAMPPLIRHQLMLPFPQRPSLDLKADLGLSILPLPCLEATNDLKNSEYLTCPQQVHETSIHT